MIFIRLAGGLGNQIFQLAGALLISKYSGIDTIALDTSGLKKYEQKRECLLNKIFDFDKIEKNILFKNFRFSNFRIPKFFPYGIFVSDKNFRHSLANANSIAILDGYFQDCLTQELYDEITSFYKQVFCLKQPSLSDKVCVIHIRGGDFVDLGWSSVCPDSYYKRSIEMMVERFNVSEFHVVTDDRLYADKILYDEDVKFKFIGGDVLTDFMVINASKYKVLSSSTFAFWASSLSNNKNGAVIAPYNWNPSRKRKLKLENECVLD